jgi:hypothetical protein
VFGRIQTQPINIRSGDESLHQLDGLKVLIERACVEHGRNKVAVHSWGIDAARFGRTFSQREDFQL